MPVCDTTWSPICVALASGHRGQHVGRHGSKPVLACFSDYASRTRSSGERNEEVFVSPDSLSFSAQRHYFRRSSPLSGVLCDASCGPLSIRQIATRGIRMRWSSWAISRWLSLKNSGRCKRGTHHMELQTFRSIRRSCVTMPVQNTIRRGIRAGQA